MGYPYPATYTEWDDDLDFPHTIFNFRETLLLLVLFISTLFIKFEGLLYLNMSSPSKRGIPGNHRGKNCGCGATTAGTIWGTIFLIIGAVLFISSNSFLSDDLQLLQSRELQLLRVPVQQVSITDKADPGKYVPVVCPKVLEEVRRSSSHRESDPNGGILYGKQVDIDPRFWISLHNAQFDHTRWSIMTHGHYYEKALSRAFVEVLQNATAGSRVLDVGGNIGYFSLLSAANGPVTVDTFEPNSKNRLRMCESLLLNHWHSEFDHHFYGDPTHVSRVNLYPFGAGRNEGVFSFEEHNNPGQGKFHEVGGVPESTDLHVLTLDSFARERGWFESRPDIAILKVDVEGMEYTVIEGAQELLQAHIVRNIFMEVSARNKKEKEINKPALLALHEAGYKLHKVGGWMGPSRDFDSPQDADIADTIMRLTVQEKVKQLNLWWTLGESTQMSRKLAK